VGDLRRKELSRPIPELEFPRQCSGQIVAAKMKEPGRPGERNNGQAPHAAKQRGAQSFDCIGLDKTQAEAGNSIKKF
jgi:hypothetical protein